MKVAVTLAKNILAPLGITGAASAIDAGIQKKMHGFGTTTLIISNEEMNDIIKILQDLEDSNILLKGGTKTIENETKEQKGGFLSMSLGTFRSIFIRKLIIKKRSCKKGTVKRNCNLVTVLQLKKALIPTHPSTKRVLLK